MEGQEIPIYGFESDATAARLGREDP